MVRDIFRRYNKLTKGNGRCSMDWKCSHRMDLPLKGVIFLGGHQNMTKKLRQVFPGWTYVSDEHLRKNVTDNKKVVFYWTGHGSHKIMRYVYSRLSPNTKIIYVTATNLPLLIEEMRSSYFVEFEKAV